MSTSLINTVRTISPAFNPFYLVIDSTEKAYTNFNYLVDIYSQASPTTLLRRFRIQPDPLYSNYGVIDISRPLSNQMTTDPLDIPFSALTENTYQSFKYTLKIGQEYQYSWNFYDNQYYSTAPYIGYLSFTSNTASHQYQVGDYIFIAQTAGYTYSEYEGAHKVVAVPNSTSIVVDYPFLGSTPVEPGTTRYLDYRKIVYTGLTTVSGLVFDSAMDYDFYSYDWYDTYCSHPALPLTILPTYTANNMLTNTNGYSVKLTNWGFLNTIIQPGQMKDCLIKCYDSTGTLLRTYDILQVGELPAYSSMPLLFHFPFGPASINNHIGYNYISGDTSYYSITLNDSGGTINYMNEYFVGIDKDCSIYKDTEILFEDTLGSYIPLNVFHTKTNAGINRTKYKKYQKYNINSTSDYIYDPQSQTNKINSISIDHTYTVNTGYLKEDMVAVIENLMYSKNVYVNWNNTGVYYPIEIIDGSFERKKKETRGTNLIDYTFSYKISNTRALNI